MTTDRAALLAAIDVKGRSSQEVARKIGLPDTEVERSLDDLVAEGLVGRFFVRDARTGLLGTAIYGLTLRGLTLRGKQQ